ncbi:ATP-binding protein, partial [Pseudonocardia sp.]|uniref:ATP-binding protein n=1 Tax=Pseudonocardia sp. TaxID=60912 RepID=UPI003D0CD576
GEAGIGKSRLIGEAIGAATVAGLPVVRGRAVPGGTPVPLRPVIELVTAAVRSLPRNRPTPDLDPYRPVLARLVPTAGARPAADVSLVVLAEAVLRLLAAVGCVAVVEDLHWADAETLAVAEYLADHLADEPAVLLMAVRSDEATPAAVLARELAVRGSAVLVEPARLDAAGTARMAAGCLGLAEGAVPATEILDLLHGSAEGLPLLVEDLLIAAARGGGLTLGGEGWRPTGALRPGRPQTFTDTVARRLSVLGRDILDVLRAAAVLGTTFRWHLLPAVVGCTEADVLDALRAAVAAGLVVADGDGFAFRHALTAAAVLDGLLPPERVALSRRAAQAMTAAERRLDGPGCVLAADLYALAGDDDSAAALLLTAGRQAMAEGAVSGAVTLLDRAAVLVGTGPAAADIALALLEAVAATGDPDRTATAGRAALDVLAGAPAGRRVAAQLLIARGQVEARPDRAHRALDAARAAAGKDPVALARVDGVAALAALHSDRPDRVAVAQQLATRAVAVAEAAGLHDVTCEALEVIGRCARLSDLDAAETAFSRQLQVAKVGQLALWRIRARNELGTIAWLRRADPGGVQAAHDAAAAAGLPLLAAGYAVDLAVFHTVLGHYDHAAVIAGRCHDVALRFGAEGLAGAAVLVQALIAAHRGRGADMDALLGLLGSAAEDGAAVPVWGLCRATLALLREDRPAALAAFERAEQAMRTMPALSGDPFTGLWVVVRLVDGSAGAEDLLDIDRHAPGSLFHRQFGGAARAIVAGRAGHTDEAAAELAGGLQVTTGPLYRHLLLRLAAEAALADGWGDPAAWLAEAEAWSTACGHHQVAAACRRLLRRAGVPIGRGGAAEVGVPPHLRRLGVTAREAEVLALLDDALTDRQIAQRLFLSSRTVEKHVASLRGKLGVTSRHLLGRAARPDG